MDNNTVTILNEEFENDKTGEKVQGITIIVEGKLKEVLDLLMKNNPDYVNYKGYNVVIPMGMYGFEDEIQERKIKYEVEGEKGAFNSLSYVVEENKVKLFCNIIFSFLSEHNLDKVLYEEFKY